MFVNCRTFSGLVLLISAVIGSAWADETRPPHDTPPAEVLPDGAVARLGDTRLQHPSVIQKIVFLPDGKSVLSSSDSIRQWDVESGRLIREMARHGSMIRSLAVSPDGSLLAYDAKSSRDDDGNLVVGPAVLEIETGRERYRLSGHQYFVESVAFSLDGKELASGGRDPAVRFWDLSDGREIRKIECKAWPTQIAYTQDGRSLVAFVEGYQRWDLMTGQVVHSRPNAREPFAASADGNVVVFGQEEPRLDYGETSWLVVWDVVNHKALGEFKVFRSLASLQSEAAQSVALSSDGKLLAVGDLTNRVHVFDVDAGTELYCSPPFEDWITCLAFSPDGATLAVGAWQQLLLWEAKTGKDRHPREGHGDRIDRIAVSPDGTKVAAQSSDALLLWDAQTGRLRQKVSKHGPFFAFSPSGNVILGDGGTLVEWLATEEKVAKTWDLPGLTSLGASHRFHVVFSRDGKTMASSGQPSIVHLWSVEHATERSRARRTSEGKRYLLDHNEHWPLGFAHDGQSVVTAAGDCVVRLLDIATGEEQRALLIESRDAVLSPDGRFLLASGKVEVSPNLDWESGSPTPLRLWDLTSGDKPQPVTFPFESVREIAVSPDSSLLALGIDEDVVLVERVSGKEVRRFQGHVADISDLVFSPDGRTLVSASTELSALIWDVTGMIQEGQLPAAQLDASAQDAVWDDLASDDAATAHRAVWTLVAAPEQVVPFLAAHLKPAESSPARLAKRFDNLVTDVEALRSHRAVIVLGQIANPEAQAVLETLAQGDPEAALTHEAAATLQRLDEQRPSSR